MKLTKFFKTIVISVLLAVSFTMAVLVMTGCDEEEPDKEKEIKQAVSAAVDFLTNAKNCGNYSSVSEYPDGRKYEYYAEGDKFQIEYNGTTYGVLEGAHLYKVYQADDMTWHKNNDTSDLKHPASRIANLINNINRQLWYDYDKKTKTLTTAYTDGSATIKLDAGAFIITFNLDTGTTRHIINNVGTTTVTLPENIIDDTQIQQTNY